MLPCTRTRPSPRLRQEITGRAAPKPTRSRCRRAPHPRNQNTHTSNLLTANDVTQPSPAHAEGRGTPGSRAAPGLRERRGIVPVFTANRSISLASSFAPAASPRLRRRPSPWPPCRHAKPVTESATHTGWPCAAPRPISTRFEPVPCLRSFNTGSSRIPSDLARRTRPVWQYQAVPALSALLPALPGVSRIRLRPAPARLLRQPGEEVSHLLRFPAPTAHQRLRRTSASCANQPQAHDR